MQITINDNDYPLQWGMGAIEIYCDMMDCDLEGLGMIEDAANPLQMQKALTVLIYAGIKNGCDVYDKECLVTLPKLKAYLSDLEQEMFKDIMEDFSNSKYLGKTLKEHLFGALQEDTDVKKKANTLTVGKIIVFCYEMGLKPKEVKSLLLKDFDLMLTGYQRRQERETNRTRHLMSFIQAFSGMGASEFTLPEQLWPLSIDEDTKKRMITTMTQAKQLYKEFTTA